MVKKEDDLINENLYKLLNYNVQFNKKNNAELIDVTLEHFLFLKNLGLEHSAYNLIFELDKTKNININKDSLLNLLTFDTISENNYWNTRNNASWIKTYKDNGP